ncbi:MAG TPA: IS481 family transposase [Steroidobacteraceae bacterium]|nr:IS481 family transposase [Steroidobacteraceae bacterium]
MSWKETCVMDERMRFVIAASEAGAVMSRVCEEFGISRTIGYKWLERYVAEGLDGLKDRSRAPRAHGRAREAELVATVLALRERYRHWGPKKLRVKLAELVPGLEPPAASTIGDWLRKEGLTQPRKRRRHCPPFTQPFQAADRPNAVWCVDFKGWFRTGDGRRCDPLTLSDAMSRYLLCCQALERTDHAHVRQACEAVFCEFGLPLAIRSDNGPPFAATGAGGLSALSLWWIKLGITPERIEPAKPQQNGRHERMHRTLKQETASPPAATLAEQQACFDRFRRSFNTERPHEALEFEVPASLYRASSRSYPCALGEPVYAEHCAVRRVRSNGEIRWAGELIFVSEVLVGEPVGVEETETGDWRVHFADIELGFIDAKRRRLSRRPLSPALKQARGFVDNACALPTTPPAPPPQQQAIDAR